VTGRVCPVKVIVCSVIRKQRKLKDSGRFIRRRRRRRQRVVVEDRSVTPE